MHLGKPNLRGEGERYNITNEQLEEYFKCVEDIVYFAENYFYIVSIDEGKHKIKLYEYQKKSLKIFTQDEVDGKKNVIVLMSRQMGKCIFSDTYITIRHTKTGEIRKIKVSEWFDMVKRQKSSE